MWWPWWPFNAADVYMGSLLPLERMLREGVVDNQITLVPALDGFRLPTFYHWWFAPFFKRKVNTLPPHREQVIELVRSMQSMVSLELSILWDDAHPRSKQVSRHTAYNKLSAPAWSTALAAHSLRYEVISGFPKACCSVQVTPLADLSDRSRAGRRCFELVLMCSPQGIFSQPGSGDWLNGTLPFSIGRQVPVYCS